MRKILLSVALMGVPLLSMANSAMVAKMPDQTSMLIITNATTCNGEPVAIFMGPDGKNIDKTCNVKIGPDTITMVFAGYGRPLQIQRAQFSDIDVSHSGANNENTPKVALTTPEQNAIRSAKQYLSFQGFSRRGLIRQLSSATGDGYEIADATVAVDSLSIDWNQEAVRSAKQYLTMQGFSCKGLIQQLSSDAGDGYTREQATYGARQAGACN